jgi:phage-related holin
LSLLENACRLGLPVSPKIKTILSQLHHGKKQKPANKLQAPI